MARRQSSHNSLYFGHALMKVERYVMVGTRVVCDGRRSNIALSLIKFSKTFSCVDFFYFFFILVIDLGLLGLDGSQLTYFGILLYFGRALKKVGR